MASLARRVHLYVDTCQRVLEHQKLHPWSAKMIRLFAIADLCERWQYTRAGVHKLIKTGDFPKPIAKVALGRTLIFSAEDILAYESTRIGLLKDTTSQPRKTKEVTLKNQDWVSDL